MNYFHIKSPELLFIAVLELLIWILILDRISFLPPLAANNIVPFTIQTS